MTGKLVVSLIVQNDGHVWDSLSKGKERVKMPNKVVELYSVLDSPVQSSANCVSGRIRSWSSRHIPMISILFA